MAGGLFGLHPGSGIIGSLLAAHVGAVILLLIARLFNRGRS
ncbi:GlsB/YeaQ/YmgE family stress response membrane protein [Paraburkholderia fungorum]